MSAKIIPIRPIPPGLQLAEDSVFKFLEAVTLAHGLEAAENVAQRALHRLADKYDGGGEAA